MFVRISMMTPQPQQMERAKDLLRELERYHHGQPGYVNGYTLENRDAAELGRISMWESEEHANASAQTEHGLALRAQLTRVVVAESHREAQFESIT